MNYIFKRTSCSFYINEKIYRRFNPFWIEHSEIIRSLCMIKRIPVKIFILVTFVY